MKKSAGILVFRELEALEVFLVHPGGPFFKRKDLGSWTIPKGEIDEGEDALAAAQREFLEETGFKLSGEFLDLKPIKQKSGKTVFAWATMEDIDPTKIVSNTFAMEWPLKSGRLEHFPEVDKAAWFRVEEVKEKIIPAQIPLIEELQARLKNK